MIGLGDLPGGESDCSSVTFAEFNPLYFPVSEVEKSIGNGLNPW
jgi:hypothetical protein